MVTYLNFLKQQQFDQLVSSIYFICELCNKTKFACCIQSICSYQKQFICADCEKKYNNSIHFLHQIIDLKSFCLNVDINKQSKTITQFYNDIINEITHYKHRMQSKVVKMKNNILEYEQNIQSSLNIILLLKQHIKMHNEKALSNKRKYLQIKDNILRKILNQSISERMSNTKLYLEQLKSQTKLNLTQQFKLADKIQVFMSFTNSETSTNIPNFISYIKNLNQKLNSFYDKQLIKKQQSLKMVLRHFSIPPRACLQLKLINIRMLNFKLIPNTVKRLFLIDMKPSQNQFKDILQNRIQLHLSNNHLILMNYYKKLFKLCLQQKVRMLTVQNITFKFGKNHEIKNKIKLIQTKRMHLSRLSLTQKLIRTQVLEMLMSQH